MPELWVRSPVGGVRGNHTLMFHSLSFSFPPLSLKINKILKKIVVEERIINMSGGKTKLYSALLSGVSSINRFPGAKEKQYCSA